MRDTNSTGKLGPRESYVTAAAARAHVCACGREGWLRVDGELRCYACARKILGRT